MTHRRFPWLKFSLCLLVPAAALYLARPLWLPAAGYLLIRDEGPAKADIAVVLAGDAYGLRILKGAELVRQGYVPAVLVSGPAGFFGGYESDFAIPFAVKRGIPASWFIPFPNEALSTQEEAAAIVPELRRRNVRSFLLVTSDYHTSRAGRIYRSVVAKSGGGMIFRLVAAPDRFFHANDWWQNRQAEKIVFIEWCKSAAAVFGL